MPNLVGERLGPYELTALLGKGGMATVYRARQTLAGRVQREVAVKVIESELALNQEFVARFEREAQTIVSLSHAHILKVFDYGQQGEMLYLVMELLSGGSLADRIRSGTLTWEDATRILDQIADAFDYAHSKGIVHRDLKPQNVLLDEAGNAYLSDFGIAKLLDETTGLTQSGTAMGTPAYMAPEQWQGGKVDALSDVYSLGVMLFEMVNGQVPFQGDTPFRVMYQHLYERPPSVRSLRPDLPPGLDQVFERALAKNPTARYQTAGALAEEFKSTALGTGMPAPTSDRTAPLPARGGITPVLASADTPPRRGRLKAGLIIGLIAGVVLVALVLVTAFSPWGDTGAEETTATAAALLALAPSDSPTAATPTSDTPETLVVQVVASETPTPTLTSQPPSATPTVTNAPPTATFTPSHTATSTPSAEPPTLTSTPSGTATTTPSVTPLPPTGTFTATPTATASATATLTPSATPSSTSTPTATSTATPSSTPTLAPGDVRLDAQNVMQVYVPAGCFMMGSLGNDADEVPVHQVCITRPFWLDRFEVTNADFESYRSQTGAAFAGTTPAGFDGPSQPRVNVSWIEAEAYARWRGCRLPSEAEWEYAARGPEARIWPWGNSQDSTKANTAESQPSFTAAVDGFADGQSWIGAYNLAGNVWEWTNDWYGADYYARSPSNDPPGPEGPGQFRILRGGSFKQDLLAARGSDRYWAPPDGRADFVGFRVACPAE